MYICPKEKIWKKAEEWVWGLRKREKGTGRVLEHKRKLLHLLI